MSANDTHEPLATGSVTSKDPIGGGDDFDWTLDFDGAAAAAAAFDTLTSVTDRDEIVN